MWGGRGAALWHAPATSSSLSEETSTPPSRDTWTPVGAWARETSSRDMALPSACPRGPSRSLSPRAPFTLLYRSLCRVSSPSHRRAVPQHSMVKYGPAREVKGLLNETRIGTALSTLLLIACALLAGRCTMLGSSFVCGGGKAGDFLPGVEPLHQLVTVFRAARRWCLGQKCYPIGPYAERKRWARSGDFNRCMHCSRWRVGWCEFSARLLR